MRDGTKSLPPSQFFPISALQMSNGADADAATAAATTAANSHPVAVAVDMMVMVGKDVHQSALATKITNLEYKLAASSMSIRILVIRAFQLVACIDAGLLACPPH